MIVISSAWERGVKREWERTNPSCAPRPPIVLQIVLDRALGETVTAPILTIPIEYYHLSDI
jgi:hypothetical protein